MSLLFRFLFLEAHELQNALERMEWSQTCQGKYFNFLGYFFSLYCTWKIFISTVNIVFDRVGKVDPITKTFDILVNWLGVNIDVSCPLIGQYPLNSLLIGQVTMWSQQLSFIVVGIIVVSSTRYKCP